MGRSLLEKWFDENKRDFPWRENRTPYRVWISEVMLQQTRASAVIPYFLRFLELFPDVKALYMAPIERVIKAWEGLGYYSRARNLSLAAREIVEKFGGNIPQTKEELLSIRGFGPYTAGAVLNFAFQKKALAIDGNVIRVITRYFCIEENISKSSTRKTIEKKTEQILDSGISWKISEALIELGATVCTQTPRCAICPLNQSCLGLKNGKAESLPIKNEKPKTIELFRHVFVIVCDDSVLVKKGEKGVVMEDLYEFPFRETGGNFLENKISFVQKLSEASHTFTRYKAHLFPRLFTAKEKLAVDHCEWVPIRHLSTLPFSSGHKKIVSQIEKIYSHR